MFLLLKRLWREDEGLLTFEWVMLNSIMVAGVVAGLSVVRDQINTELQNVVTSMHAALHPSNNQDTSTMPSNAVGWIDQQGTIHYNNPSNTTNSSTISMPLTTQ